MATNLDFTVKTVGARAMPNYPETVVVCPVCGRNGMPLDGLIIHGQAGLALRDHCRTDPGEARAKIEAELAESAKAKKGRTAEQRRRAAEELARIRAEPHGNIWLWLEAQPKRGFVPPAYARIQARRQTKKRGLEPARIRSAAIVELAAGFFILLDYAADRWEDAI